MTTSNNQITETLTEEQAQQLAETAAKAGLSTEEAVAVLNEKLPALINAITAAIPAIVDAMRNAIEKFAEMAKQIDIDEKILKPVATPKEWNMMNHAKKSRTRKKYRNRLIKRLREQEGDRHGVHTT